MKVSLLIFLSVFLWLNLHLIANASPVRIAIIDTSAQNELEPLLVTELSKAEGVQLVERAEIDKVLRERARSEFGNLSAQLSVASILHADGLLILDKVNLKEGDALSVRLTASGPGVVIGSAIFALRKGDPVGLAHDIISRFQPMWGKLSVKRERAIPISLLNLRCVVKAQATETLENQLTFLFGNRLIAQRELFVLERWRLGDAVFEKAFTNAGEGAFWNGSYVVDGEIQTSGTIPPFKLSVKVFAHAPGGKETKMIEVTGDGEKLPELATALADQVAKLFAKEPPTGAWDAMEESREYLREAGWAYRNRLFQVARPALEASGALGNREAHWYRLGARIYSAFAYPIEVDGPKITNKDSSSPVDVSREPERIRSAQKALDCLRELMATPLEKKPAEDKPASPAVRDIRPWWEVDYDRRGNIGNIVLTAASLVLRNAYEHGLRTDPALAELRTGIRELYPQLVKWREPQPKWAGEHPELVATMFYPYWFETTAEQLDTLRALLRHQPIRDVALPMIRMRALLMRCNRVPDIELERIDDAPRLLSWKGTPPQQLQSEWRSFINSLLASSSALDQIDGMLLQMADEPRGKEGLARKTLEECWNARDALVAANRVEAVVGLLDSYFHEDARIIDHASRIKWLVYFLEHSSKEDFRLLHRLCVPNTFTPQEAGAVFKGLLCHADHLIKGDMDRQPLDDFEYELLRKFPQLRPPLPKNGLHVAQFHVFPEMFSLPQPDRAVHMQRSGGKIWACVTTPYASTFKGWIYGIDSNDFTVKERIAFPVISKYDRRFENFFACDAAFYYIFGNNVLRYNRKTHAWTSISLPSGGWTSLAPVGDDFFIVSSANNSQDRNSTILKWTASTGELSTISNSRRRPPHNRLDDCGEYLDARLFLGPGGKAGAMINFKPFFYNEATDQWEKVDGTENACSWAFSNDENSVILSWYGTVCLMHTRKELPITWYRGNTPANTKDSCILDSAMGYAGAHGTYAVESTVSFCNGKLWHCLPRDDSHTYYHLLRCIDWASQSASAPHVSIDFELPNEVKRLTQIPENFQTGVATILNVLATEKGAIIWRPYLPGFWFISSEEMEKAQQQVTASTPEPSASPAK